MILHIRIESCTPLLPKIFNEKLKLMLATSATLLDHIFVQLTLSVGGCGQMYEAIIVSPQFTKKTTLARHRLVNAALKDEIAAIHAWTPKCHTPEEWEKKKPQ